MIRAATPVLSEKARQCSRNATPSAIPGWEADYAGTPIRLEITCIRAADPPWVLKVEVEPPRPTFTTTVQRLARQIEVTATNVGTSHARDVRFGGAAMLDSCEVKVLEVGRRTTATIAVTAAGAPGSVELHWTDRLGVPARRLIDL